MEIEYNKNVILTADELACTIKVLAELRVVDVAEDSIVPLKTTLNKMKAALKEMMG
jgi:hypothetical protein